jgi:hypothetical protein
VTRKPRGSNREADQVPEQRSEHSGRVAGREGRVAHSFVSFANEWGHTDVCSSQIADRPMSTLLLCPHG